MVVVSPFSLPPFSFGKRKRSEPFPHRAAKLCFASFFLRKKEPKGEKEMEDSVEVKWIAERRVRGYAYWTDYLKVAERTVTITVSNMYTWVTRIIYMNAVYWRVNSVNRLLLQLCVSAACPLVAVVSHTYLPAKQGFAAPLFASFPTPSKAKLLKV